MTKELEDAVQLSLFDLGMSVTSVSKVLGLGSNIVARHYENFGGHDKFGQTKEEDFIKIARKMAGRFKEMVKDGYGGPLVAKLHQALTKYLNNLQPQKFTVQKRLISNN